MLHIQTDVSAALGNIFSVMHFKVSVVALCFVFGNEYKGENQGERWSKMLGHREIKVRGTVPAD